MWTLQCRALSQVRKSFPGNDISWNGWLARLSLYPDYLTLFAGECLIYLHGCLQGLRGTIKTLPCCMLCSQHFSHCPEFFTEWSFPVSSTVQFSMQLVAPNSIAKLIFSPTFRRGEWSFHNFYSLYWLTSIFRIFHNCITWAGQGGGWVLPWGCQSE